MENMVNIEINFLDGDRKEIDDVVGIENIGTMVSFNRNDGVEFSIPVSAIKYIVKRPVVEEGEPE